MKPVGPADVAGLESRLGYAFKTSALLRQALTHMSGAGGDMARLSSYQRLEFLGDRVLGLVVSAMLYAEFPQATEGELSRRLAELVRSETCAEVALDWDLGPYVRLGPGELQAGGRQRPAILADVCEALVGAVFLDGGFEAAAALVVAAWRTRMLASRRDLRDAKTALQEWVQGLGQPPPVYHEVERSGPAHAPQFVIAVTVSSHEPARGMGSSKRAAEQAAAEAFMAREGFAGLAAASPADRLL